MIQDDDKTFIFLSALELSYKKMSDIISHFERPSDFFDAFLNEQDFLVKEFGALYSEYRAKYNDFSFDTF